MDPDMDIFIARPEEINSKIKFTKLRNIDIVKDYQLEPFEIEKNKIISHKKSIILFTIIFILIILNRKNKKILIVIFIIILLLIFFMIIYTKNNKLEFW